MFISNISDLVLMRLHALSDCLYYISEISNEIVFLYHLSLSQTLLILALLSSLLLLTCYCLLLLIDVVVLLALSTHASFTVASVCQYTTNEKEADTFPVLTYDLLL